MISPHDCGGRMAWRSPCWRWTCRSPPPPTSCGSRRIASASRSPCWSTMPASARTVTSPTPTRKRLEEAIELNCRTLVGTTARYLPQMRARGAGTIINVASIAAFQPLPKMAVYGASKAFVLSFTEAVWAEERKHGVRVFAVCPGLTDTPFFELAGDAAASAASSSAALGPSPALRSRSSTPRCVRCRAANPASSMALPTPSSRGCSPGCCQGGWRSQCPGGMVGG